MRACHDALLADPKTPALFPFGGFGLILVAGTPADGRFFVRRILSFIPTVRRRHLTIPLRKLNYLSDRASIAIIASAEDFDPILPPRFQPEWNAGSTSLLPTSISRRNLLKGACPQKQSVKLVAWDCSGGSLKRRFPGT
jgi:hypothetical protein